MKVAFIADGLDINNPDFIRADGNHVFVDYQDFSGDGLERADRCGRGVRRREFAIAAQGREIYDLADYVNAAHPLPAGCTIRIRGMAPGREPDRAEGVRQLATTRRPRGSSRRSTTR